MPYIPDIAANMTDSMYKGQYHGSQKHQPDLEAVLQRSWKHGIEKIMITGTSLKESKEAVEMAKTDGDPVLTILSLVPCSMGLFFSPERLYATVGCHPTMCSEFEAEGQDPEEYAKSLEALARDNLDQVVALGEFGLDYDRLHFCPAEVQKKYFRRQMEMAAAVESLPLFLHCRNSADDLVQILSEFRDQFKAGGVVHSFDGSFEEAQKIIDLGYHIGLNGWYWHVSSNPTCIFHIRCFSAP